MQIEKCRQARTAFVWCKSLNIFVESSKCIFWKLELPLVLCTRFSAKMLWGDKGGFIDW